VADIIKTLEEATEGSRELDAEIELSRRRFLGLLGAGAVVCSVPGWLAGPGVGEQPIKAPHYTTSLDAALTLVPEGWSGRLWFGQKPRKRQPEYESDAVVWASDDTVKASFWGPNGNAATPALAVCIVALKAREAL
jgi:hypothetical protein